MASSDEIYIAREILVGDHGLIRIDEEGIFSSFENANKFLESLRSEHDQDGAAFADNGFIHEIVKMMVNDHESWEQKVTWTYRTNGDLISKINAKAEPLNAFASVVYRNLYQVGDIVRVKSLFEVPESYLAASNWGVIGEAPTSKQDWQKSGKHLGDWSGCYIVWLISPDTHWLYHEHLPEVCLEPLTGAIPGDLVFLTHLSRYFKGEGDIYSADEIKRTFSENIVVRKIDYFYDRAARPTS